MARVNITPVAVIGPYPALPVAANALDIVLTAADASEKNQASVAGSRQLLLALNTGAGAHTVTLTSAADDKGRSGDISAYSVGAGELMAFLFKSPGWRQTDGKLYFEANDPEVKFAVINID